MKVLLILLLIFLLLGMIPIGVFARYSGEGPRLLLKFGPVSICLIPRKPRKAGKNPEKKAKKQKIKQEKPQKTAEAETEEQSGSQIGGLLPLFRELLPLALDAARHIIRTIKIRHLRLYLRMGAREQDPAKAAMLYGGAWALIGEILPVLENIFIIKDRDIQATIDYLSDETTIFVQAQLTLTLGEILWIGIYYGISALRKFLQFRKIRKGGQSNGTSYQ